MENTYIGLETTFSLFMSYEVLARAYKKNNHPKDEVDLGFDGAHKSWFKAVPSMNYDNCGYTFALLNINAAIVEGVMRSILSQIVSDEKDRQVDIGISEGRTKRTHPENLLNRFHIDIDSAGGWRKLKEQYERYLKLSITASSKPETKDAIETLFILRNIFAHGTALIHPKYELSEDFKDEPIYNWQSKLKGAAVYLKKHFKHDIIFDNLAEYSVPEHFLEKTKDFFNDILPVIGYSGERSKKTINAILNYSFGFIAVYR